MVPSPECVNNTLQKIFSSSSCLISVLDSADSLAPPPHTHTHYRSTVWERTREKKRKERNTPPSRGKTRRGVAWFLGRRRLRWPKASLVFFIKSVDLLLQAVIYYLLPRPWPKRREMDERSSCQHLIFFLFHHHQHKTKKGRRSRAPSKILIIDQTAASSFPPPLKSFQAQR